MAIPACWQVIALVLAALAAKVPMMATPPHRNSPFGAASSDAHRVRRLGYPSLSPSS